MTPHLAADLEEEEGREPEAYPDPLSPLGQAVAAHRLPMRDYRRVVDWQHLDPFPWTIGVGCTGPAIGCGTRWTEEKIDAERDRRIAEKVAGLDRAISWWRKLSAPRQDVLVQMAFQMGVSGLLAFKTTLGRIRRGDYAGAQASMLESRWARQTPRRARRLAQQMATGVRA